MARSIFFHTAVLWIGLTTTVSAFTGANDHWTHFRGSNLDGIARVQTCPVQWAPDSNIVWKQKIHGKGWSSPVVYGDRIWTTTATEDGMEMSVVCIDFNTGAVVHDEVIFRPDTVYRKHDINSYATPSPCVEQERVYVHFGRYGTACLSAADGSMIWKRDDLQCEHVQGPGSSPIIYNDLLIVHMEGTDRQAIYGLNKFTGEVVWETERPEKVYAPLKPIGKKAYITPLVINVQGRDLLISNGSAVCMAYDPSSGEEIWRLVRGEDSTIAMPAYEDGTVFFYTGYITAEGKRRFAELLAVDPSGHGNIANTHVIWKMETPILQLSTPLVKDGLMYTVDTKNMLMCLDASSGEVLYSKRLRGKYNASPVYAAGRIYLSSTNGTTTVIEEGRELNIISENELEGEIWATPAVVNNNMLIRTSAYLYRIGR